MLKIASSSILYGAYIGSCEVKRYALRKFSHGVVSAARDTEARMRQSFRAPPPCQRRRQTRRSILSNRDSRPLRTNAECAASLPAVATQ
jgi:hypothetical protein